MKNQTSTTELSRMTADELRRDLAMHRIEYAKMRMDIELQKEKNHALFKQKRKEIARMSTVLTAMQRGQKTTKVPAAESVQKASQPTKKPVKRSGTKSKKS